VPADRSSTAAQSHPECPGRLRWHRGPGERPV